jgi:hypothetical protein
MRCVSLSTCFKSHYGREFGISIVISSVGFGDASKIQGLQSLERLPVERSKKMARKFNS